MNMETVYLYSMGKRPQLAAIFDNDAEANAHMETPMTQWSPRSANSCCLRTNMTPASQLNELLDALAIGLAMAEDAQEYAQETLAEHLLALGETTQKNKTKATRIRQDIAAAKDAQIPSRGILTHSTDRR